MKSELIQPEQLAPAAERSSKTLEEIDRILMGRPELHRMVLIGILSQGHILLEGVPGVGKTQLVKSLGKLLNLDTDRLQFTPDLMPSDITGTHILQQTEEGRREMVFQAGPIFTNILLADEINRASPKTQSALLEAMQEGSVTLMGTTRPLPKPFFVLATQNPIELEGTYPLPEAQLDRFLFKLNVPSADLNTLEAIISTRRRGEPPEPTWTVSAEEIQEMFQIMERIYLPAAGGKIHRPLDGRDPPGQRRSDRVGQNLCQLPRVAASRHCDCGSGARLGAHSGAPFGRI